ncbi:MAG TPA: metallophosphoesterase family protein [Candidatus Obscuribacterales bacterium]
MMIAVLADTHVPKRAKTLPARAWDILRQADAIIHAGDVLNEQFLDELRMLAIPLHAVRGNNDITLRHLPETLELGLEGVRVAVIHDSGAKKGRAERMTKRFPNADLIIFGHSHIPVNERHGAVLLFNPGSPTDRRRQPSCTMGLLHISAGHVQVEIIPVTDAASTG